jgi:SAM-dependent methyltransferase
MANETNKTNLIRSQQFFSDYCCGDVIDIGAGDSPVTNTAKVFDVVDGDAQHILEYFDEQSFDCVYSSHCLEHLEKPLAVIQEWWKLVRPGGFLIVVVPDEDLYEQGVWPSMFNSDHKSTFTICKKNSWSPVSINLKEVLTGLAKSKVISIELHDHNYDYRLRRKRIWPRLHSCIAITKKTGLRYFVKKAYFYFMYFLYFICKVPRTPSGRFIDQTEGRALAQIQAIVKKGN